MKIYLKLAVLVLILGFVGCDKEKKLKNDLDGTWELRRITGGFRVADSQSEFPAGNGRIMKFEGNTYQRINDGAVYSSGTFTIVKEEQAIDGTKFSYKLDFDQTMDQDVHATMSKGKLLLSSGSMAHDGATLTYEKL